MEQKQILEEFLKKTGRSYCDDCLVDKTNIARQNINRIARELADNDIIMRKCDICFCCRKRKLVNKKC